MSFYNTTAPNSG